MDLFLSRKRKRPSPLRDLQPLPLRPPSKPELENDDDTTDIKLAILASLYPTHDHSGLLEALVANNGSIEETSAFLKSQRSSASSPRKAAGPNGLQSALPFILPSGVVPKKPLTKRGRTLHLYSPADVAAHTPCSIIHNFLPPDQAERLLQEILPETPSFPRARFKLFDQVVQSPHSAAFFVNSLEEQKRQITEYLYNGSILSDVREILPEMRKVSVAVEQAVNNEIAARIKDHYPDGQKLKYQCSAPWKANAAFVNCYDGGAESVGYHSDQLSYLGPRAVIGSLSLGVAREFRVRKIIGKDKTETTTSAQSRADQEGQIAIHLPHNSFLVMHAEMQEEWKHSIAAASTVEPHPLTGNKRINITYRWYRDSFRPCYTPKCRCGIATVLKCVQKGRENRGRYMWMCQAGGIPGKESCGFFEWAEFTDQGEPVWKSKNDKVGEGSGRAPGES